jgi:uncharacterized membrane protein HdeD (DUF308 family)
MTFLSTTLMRPSQRSIGWSIVMMLAGLIAIGAPLATGITVNVLIAWMLLVSGAAHLAYGWQTRDNGGFLWELLLSVVHGIAALYLLMQPIGALASLTAVLALYLTGKATLEIIASLQHRSVRGSGWLLFDGIFTSILAIMIWYTWPWSSVYAIGTLVGLSLLFSGAARLLHSTADYTAAPV